MTGVRNDSNSSIGSLQLSSNTDLFGFDGDGLCTYGVSGCPFGPTGYEGPGTSFSNISSGFNGGTVTFNPAIPPGGTAYFSLEESLQAALVFSGGPSTSQQGGAPNPSSLPTTCSSGRPVNCATGTFWHTYTDAKAPGLGVPLDFTRTYQSSSAASDGPFGYGWTSSYGMSLSIDNGSGDAAVVQENGSTADFKASGGAFVSAPWILATLANNGDGTYTFTRDSTNVRYVFNSSGQLIHEIDRNDYSTDLSYDGSGHLTTITDQAGPTIALSYDGDHVGQLTDAMGHHSSYSYDADGNLVQVTDPLGRSYAFTYDSGHLLLSTTNPRGGSVANTYDGSNRVITQVDPAGRTTTWAYNGDPASAGGSTTTITDPRGNDTTYSYANLELNSITRAAGTSGAATTTFQYDPPSWVAPGSPTPTATPPRTPTTRAGT